MRSYPLRPTNEPRVYVAGERMGQRVSHPGPTSLPPTSSPHPVHVAQPNGVGIGMGLGLGIGSMNQAAALAQQNQAMEALERERRNRSMAPLPGGTLVTLLSDGLIFVSDKPAIQRSPDEDDSGGDSVSDSRIRHDSHLFTDEYENVSTRSLAIERFKRNHELMADVFTYASKGPTSFFTHFQLLRSDSQGIEQHLV